MPRIVITSWGSYGDIYPYIGLALALRERGHEPVLAVPPLYRDLVRREALAFQPVRPDLDPADRALAARIMNPARGPQTIFREVLVPTLTQSYADLMAATADAALLITHPASLAAPIVAGERGLLWASSVLAPLSFFSAYDPMVPPNAPWVYSLLARSPGVARMFLRGGDWLTARWVEPVQRFRQSRGLARGANPVVAGQHSPHLVLALFSRLLASPQRDWPANVALTGAMLYNGPPDEPLPADLLRFLDFGQPPIVFTLGTSAVFAAGQFYEVSARVSARLGRRAVLLVGPNVENRPSSVPPDVFVADYAPHAPLFARAAAVVHQGGVGTLQQAMAAGSPQLVVPHSHDQPDNARRVTALGIARTLFPQRYTAARVERELHLLLDTPDYSVRAADVGAVVRREDGPRRAVDAIDALLDRHAAQT